MKVKLHKSQSGFTLIELMATFAILALIVVIAVPSIGTLIANADEKSEAASIAMIENAGGIADVAGLAHDNKNQQWYLVTTLITEGYLDMATDDDLVVGGSYVQKIGDTGNTYEYKGVPEPTDVSMFTFNGAGDTVTGFSDLRPDDLTDIVIPWDNNGVKVTNIGDNAFKNNNITFVVIPDSVTSIGASAFSYNRLTSLTIPNSMEIIGSAAFHSNNLVSIIIPVSMKAVGGYAFTNNNLTTITIPASVTSIGTSAFRNNNLVSVTIPDSVETIGRWAFENNKLTSVRISDSVKTLGVDAFRGNDGIIIYGSADKAAPEYILQPGQSFVEN